MRKPSWLQVSGEQMNLIKRSFFAALIAALVASAPYAWGASDQLKTARLTDSTLASQIDDKIGELETALGIILGITLDSNVSALFTITEDGFITVVSDFTLKDNTKLTLGTGGDVDIYYDTTNLIIDAAVVGTGQIQLDTEDARTNTVDLMLQLESLSTGTETAGVGTGIQYNASTPSESPMPLGSTNFIATDVANDSEDTEFTIHLRTAGSAIEEKYNFRTTAGDGFTAIFTHANTADRTYTFPDEDATLGSAGGGASTIQLNDNVNILYGTGSDSATYYDATNLFIEPDLVGSGAVIILATKDDISTAANVGVLNVQTDAYSGATTLQSWYANRSGGASSDGDDIRLNFMFNDSASTIRAVGRIRVEFDDVTDSTMDSSFVFSTMSAVNQDDVDTDATLTNTGVWTDASSYAMFKTFEKEVTPATVLTKLGNMYVGRYRRKKDPNEDEMERHIGPTADEFHNTFQTGKGIEGIAAHDMAGVALMAIQGLLIRLEALEGAPVRSKPVMPSGSPRHAHN